MDAQIDEAAERVKYLATIRKEWDLPTWVTDENMIERFPGGFLVWLAAKRAVLSEEKLVPPMAYARKWHITGERPIKEKNSNNRLAYPWKFKLLPVTINKCLSDDVALYLQRSQQMLVNAHLHPGLQCSKELALLSWQFTWFTRPVTRRQKRREIPEDEAAFDRMGAMVMAVCWIALLGIILAVWLK